jgi:hypothetical protein
MPKAKSTDEKPLIRCFYIYPAGHERAGERCDEHFKSQHGNCAYCIAHRLMKAKGKA